VYVHFPWCLQKCPYCDFASYAVARPDVPHARYADAVTRELSLRTGETPPAASIASVFFGGGTPSLWEPAELGRVLEAVRSRLPTTDDLEVTAECNPSSLDAARARALVGVGVGRLSVGVQSLDPERLAFLGRLHDAARGLGALADALAAGARVSGDLIFGVAGGRAQAPADAAREARVVARTGVGHVSAYSLTIESGTQFGALARRGRLPIASEGELADSFLAVDEALEAEGLEHYEISSYARPGERARHNLGTWRGEPYLGLGAGAVGLVERDGTAVRYRNQPDPRRYLESIERGELDVVEEETLDPETRLRERIMMGLRLSEGLALGAAAASLGVEALPPSRERALERLVRAGRVQVSGDLRLTLPRAAWLFADGIAAELF
jgi:putative oxygen-independent coproporphyrinogen III oxidase